MCKQTSNYPKGSLPEQLEEETEGQLGDPGSPGKRPLKRWWHGGGVLVLAAVTPAEHQLSMCMCASFPALLGSKSKLEVKDVLPNINCTQAAERAENAVFVPCDLDLQTRLSKGPNTSSV